MSTIKANYILDAAGGNTATINGAIPAPAISPTLTNPIISGNLGAGGANYGTSGQVLTSGGAGASTSWSTIATGGMTLLGTLATTSGTLVTLSGLDLTSYKFVVAAFKTVSVTIDAGVGLRGNGTGAGINIAPSTGGNANGINGILQINLTTGVYSSTMSTVAIATPAWAVSTPYAGNQTVVGTATTSIGFDVGGGTFDAGSITIYGVK